jgi:hypothetical protein
MTAMGAWAGLLLHGLVCYNIFDETVEIQKSAITPGREATRETRREQTLVIDSDHLIDFGLIGKPPTLPNIKGAGSLQGVSASRYPSR